MYVVYADSGTCYGLYSVMLHTIFLEIICFYVWRGSLDFILFLFYDSNSKALRLIPYTGRLQH